LTKPASRSLGVAAVLSALSLLSVARAETEMPRCDVPLDVIRLENPLPRVSQKLAAGAPLKIVAIGSSSTAGAGASSPAANYPNRLAIDLRQKFPRSEITVLNRGVSGEEILDMLRRFPRAVIAEKPDLVLWQLGTNSVLRHHPFADHGAAIRDGLDRIRKIGADVVLIDPQFTPKVIAKADAEQMVDLIALTAKQENVDLFRRFEVMRRWHDVDHLPFSVISSPDGLHMNDWSYACLARGLGRAIAEAATRPVTAASTASSAR
jgi:lysophospholipase L1-like esterase